MKYTTKIRISFWILVCGLLFMNVYSELHTNFSLSTTMITISLGIIITIVGFLFVLSARRDINKIMQRKEEK